MGLRELLILLLILAIVGVILRGLFVAIRARRGQLRMQLDKNVPQYDPEELTLSELPNGGARSVERSFAQVVQQNSEFSAKDRRKIASGEHAIPVLMDTVGAEDEDDEEEDELPRQSSVASARESARQKHLKGQGQRNAASAAVASHSESVSATPVVHQDANLSVAPSDEQDEDDLEDDFDYEEDDVNFKYPDPLDSHVFSKDEDDEDEDEPVIPAYGDFRDTDSGDDDLDDDDIDEEGPSENSADPDGDGLDDDEDEYDDAPSEDSVDPDDAFDDEDDFDDEEQSPIAFDKNPDPEGWDDEDDAEDEEVEQDEIDAVEFDEVYNDDAQRPENLQDDGFDDDDDDDGWDDESLEQEEVSAPRRWLKWAGDKISNMGAEQDEPVREREFHVEDRAEPIIGLDDFEVEPSKQAPRSDVVEAQNKKAALDKSRQAQLFAEEFASDEIEEEAPTAAPEPAPVRAPAPKAEIEKAAAKASPRPVLQEPETPKEYNEVLVINVVAKPDAEFLGVELLPALLASGLRFGEMSIFHRHFDTDASSPVIFSVANMLNPGTFDLNQINDFATRGVCFFMTLPNAATSMQAFNIMLDAAQSLRIALDGDLKDDNRSVMTAQTIEHYRQRVLDFDLRQLRQPK
ncbi:MAG: cell division protein ZipA [Gammaproteobacteria bacterium]